MEKFDQANMLMSDFNKGSLTTGTGGTGAKILIETSDGSIKLKQ